MENEEKPSRGAEESRKAHGRHDGCSYGHDA